MGIEYWFLFLCVGFLVLLTVALTINTCISGSKYFKGFQMLMSSMQYSKTADETIKRILDKTEAGILVATLSDNTIKFVDPTSEPKQEIDRYSTYHNVRYIEVRQAEAEIWIATKYYSYGYVHRYYGEQKSELYKKRPSLSTFKRIVKLEEQLRSTPAVNAAPSVAPQNKDKKVVELQ